MSHSAGPHGPHRGVHAALPALRGRGPDGARVRRPEHARAPGARRPARRTLTDGRIGPSPEAARSRARAGHHRRRGPPCPPPAGPLRRPATGPRCAVRQRAASGPASSRARAACSVDVHAHHPGRVRGSAGMRRYSRYGTVRPAECTYSGSRRSLGRGRTCLARPALGDKWSCPRPDAPSGSERRLGRTGAPRRAAEKPRRSTMRRGPGVRARAQRSEQHYARSSPGVRSGSASSRYSSGALSYQRASSSS